MTRTDHTGASASPPPAPSPRVAWCDGCDNPRVEVERLTVVPRDTDDPQTPEPFTGDYCARCVERLRGDSDPYWCLPAAVPGRGVLRRERLLARPTVPDIVTFLGGRRESTGGNCTCFRFDHGDTVTIITDGDASAPLDLRQEADAWTGDREAWESGVVGMNEGTSQRAPLAVILWDLWGNEAGSLVLPILADVHRIATDYPGGDAVNHCRCDSISGEVRRADGWLYCGRCRGRIGDGAQ